MAINWTRIATIIKAAESAESAIVPVFVHSSTAQGIAAVIMAEEDQVAAIFASFGAAKTPPKP